LTYSIIIIPLATVTAYYKDMFTTINNIFIREGICTLKNDSYESLYDWTINQAFNNVTNRLFQVRLYSHYRHDVYRCIYDSIGSYIEAYLQNIILTHKYYFSKHDTIKLLVAGDNLIVAKGKGYD